MKILDIAFKDLKRSFRSMFAIGMMFVAPLLITGLIYFAFGGLSGGTGRFNLPPLTLAVVNQDEPIAGQPAFGQMLIDYFNDAAMPEWLNVLVAPSAGIARSWVDAREAGVALIIPPGFSKAVLANEDTAPLTLIHDPTLTIGPQIVQDLARLYMDSVTGARIALTTVSNQTQGIDATALQAIAQQYTTWVADTERNIHHSDTPILAVRSPVQSDAAPVDETKRILSTVMGGMLIFFVFFTGANTAQSILREDEEGTLARLFTTPTSRTSILAGKFVAVFIIIGVQALVLITVSALLFNIRWGELASIALVLLGVIVAAAGFGVCLVSFIKTLRQSGPIIGGVLTVSGMAGGLFTSGVQLPAAFETINLSMPQGWALRSLRLALDGAGAVDVLPPVLVMLAIGAVLFAVGATTFRRRFA
jgi:ABC-2 type transport system permease protein